MLTTRFLSLSTSLTKSITKLFVDFLIQTTRFKAGGDILSKLLVLFEDFRDQRQRNVKVWIKNRWIICEFLDVLFDFCYVTPIVATTPKK